MCPITLQEGQHHAAFPKLAPDISGAESSWHPFKEGVGWIYKGLRPRKKKEREELASSSGSWAGWEPLRRRAVDSRPTPPPHHGQLHLCPGSDLAGPHRILMRGQVSLGGWLGGLGRGTRRQEAYRGDGGGVGGDPWGRRAGYLLPRRRWVVLVRPGWAGRLYCGGKGSRVKGLPEKAGVGGREPWV